MTDKPSLWEQQIKAQIQRRYAQQAADGRLHSNAVDSMRDAGYPKDWIDQLPDALVKAFSGCGCPLADLKLAGEEVVMDLGAGAGIDSFLAASRLSTGQVISVDFTAEMLSTAATTTTEEQVIRVAADIERLPFPDHLADLILANASFTLATDKSKAMAEAHRVLKPGGRLAMCDLVHDGDLPRDIIEDPLAYTSSLGGVVSPRHLKDLAAAAGFQDVHMSNYRPFSYVSAVTLTAHRPL